MKKLITTAALAAMLALALGLTACHTPQDPANAGSVQGNGGTICLKVNPEIAVTYDNDGVVTGITARNDDALAIIAGYSFQGKPAKTVVSELVTAIGDAGYFVEELEGERRQITLEIEPGSALPNAAFLDDVIAEVKTVVEQRQWIAPLRVEGTSDYGMSDYVDTDYGVGADGATNYDDSDYGMRADGITDFDHHDNDDSDYGPNNDGVTDYDGTDYAANTDYGPNADGDSDYRVSPAPGSAQSNGQSAYGDSAYGNSGAGASNYGNSSYGGAANTNYGSNSNSNYGGGSSGSNSNSNYGGASSGNGGNSTYGVS